MIIPSIASANPLAYGEAIESLGGCLSLHIDMEDGNFIPNITFGLKTVRAIRAAYPDLILNAHLMVANPAYYIEDLAALGIRELAIHLEALPYPLAVLNKARSLGLTSGLALNFATPVASIAPFIREIDFLLLMTSEPDNRGELFHPSAPARISQAASLLGPQKPVWVDGGIGEAEIPIIRDAGAAIAIMGRAIFSAPNPADKLSQLTRLLSRVQ
jgi:ribulose-phosphate 3-epimerase